MSRYFNSFMDDYSEELEHSWGTSPKAKAREKEYNHWYYQKHKDEIAAIRKQRREATKKFKQAEKHRKDAERYWSLSTKMYDKYFENPETLTDSNFHSPYESYKKYMKMYEESEAKYRELNYQADGLKGLARVETYTMLQRIKHPTVRELVEFYLDTTIEKAKKAANKAKKYATKAVSNAEKHATKTIKSVANKAEKYATKAVSAYEKAAKK